MAIWSRIFGGWKTWGPNQMQGSGAFDSGTSSPLYSNVSADTAMRIAAYNACIQMRAETIGSLPLQLRDEKKNIIKDHDLYRVLHDSPNAYMTAPEYWSWVTQQMDNQGNALSIIQRRSDKSVISLEPVYDVLVQLDARKGGKMFWRIGADTYAYEDILHCRNFGLDPLWGLGVLQSGCQILSAQMSANEAAIKGFKQGLKVGGFFAVENNLNDPQLDAFKRRLDEYGKPENAGKWMTLLKGMTPHAGNPNKPVEMELLQSRYFGVEEICRLCRVPPQLIGHTDKASSWASSIENINLFYLMYSLQPTFVRIERRIEKSLVPLQDRGRIQARFSVAGLLRASIEQQTKMFASALEHGYYNVNDVLDLLDRPGIGAEGDVYRVYANTGVGAKDGEGDKGSKK